MTTIGDVQNRVLVDLSEIEAARFVQFQKNYANFCTMLDSGVFDVRNGKAIVNFDDDAKISSIDFHIAGFRRGQRILHVITPLAE